MANLSKVWHSSFDMIRIFDSWTFWQISKFNSSSIFGLSLSMNFIVAHFSHDFFFRVCIYSRCVILVRNESKSIELMSWMVSTWPEFNLFTFNQMYLATGGFFRFWYSKWYRRQFLLCACMTVRIHRYSTYGKRIMQPIFSHSLTLNSFTCWSTHSHSEQSSFVILFSIRSAGLSLPIQSS